MAATAQRGRTRAGPCLAAAVICVAVAVAALSPSAEGSAAAAGRRSAATEYYVALGDSVPMWNGELSYPYLIAKNEIAHVPGLVVEDLACSGETSASFIHHSLCAPGGSQLSEADSFLAHHRHHVALVTIDIGGNDLVGCVSASDVAGCIAAAMKTVHKNLTLIMTALRSAAGAATPVVGMNYFDPLLGDWLAGGSERSLAVASSSVLVNLNTLLARIYREASKAPTANVATLFQITNFSTFVASKWGRVPVAVSRACGWLDIVCERGSPEGYGDDPNRSGAIVIAHAFLKIIGVLKPPGSG